MCGVRREGLGDCHTAFQSGGCGYCFLVLVTDFLQLTRWLMGTLALAGSCTLCSVSVIYPGGSCLLQAAGTPGACCSLLCLLILLPHACCSLLCTTAHVHDAGRALAVVWVGKKEAGSRGPVGAAGHMVLGCVGSLLHDSLGGQHAGVLCPLGDRCPTTAVLGAEAAD